jgi:hypothetical protein
LSVAVIFAISSAVLVALLVADFFLCRFAIRALFGLIGRLPPYRPGGRYRSQSTPASMLHYTNHGTAANHHLTLAAQRGRPIWVGLAA